MAHRKGKNDKTSGGEGNQNGTALILDYLRKQNRPYSAIDISTNLHNKVTKMNIALQSKAYVAKALRELHQDKKVAGQTSGLLREELGKQTVYHALQEESTEDSPAAVVALGEAIRLLQEELGSLKGNEKKARAELATLSAKPLLSELKLDISQLEQEKETILARLSQFRQGQRGSERVSPEEKADIYREWKRWQGHVNTRSLICRNLWQQCSEVVPEDMSREELWESLGLEGNYPG